MEISYFREFVVLAETLNYWEASERLFIGQSSLSKHIKTLEKQLGALLFERTSRKVSLTEFGKLMLPYAQSVAKLQSEYEMAALGYLQTDTMELRIASIPAFSHYNITDILVKYQLDFPKVQLNIMEADTMTAREWLLEQKCDLAFFRDSKDYLEHDPDKEARLIKLPYWQDRLVAVLPQDHPLSKEKQLELSRLANESFVMIKPGTMPYILCMRACQEAGFAPQVLFTSHNLDAILDMVTKGSCVALLFEGHVASRHMSGAHDLPFTAIPITPTIPTTIYLSYLKDRNLPPSALHFIDYCQFTAPSSLSVS